MAREGHCPGAFAAGPLLCSVLQLIRTASQGKRTCVFMLFSSS